MFDSIHEWFKWAAEYAAANPGQFLFTILLILSPFFAISGFLSYKLAKHLEAEEKKKKNKERIISNIKNKNPGPRSKRD